MAKTYTCRDVGVDCDWRAHADTVEEMMNIISEHASTVHNMVAIPADLRDKVVAAIHDE